MKLLVLMVVTFPESFSWVRHEAASYPSWRTALLLSSHGCFHLFSLFFVDPSGNIHPEIINEKGNPSYKYFYTNAEQGTCELSSNWALSQMAIVALAAL